jgi:hypothetical protein
MNECEMLPIHIHWWNKIICNGIQAPGDKVLPLVKIIW